MKSYKYRLYPSEIIKVIINKDLEICRWLYNHLRELRIKKWEENHNKVSYSQQQNLLPTLKKEHPFLKEVYSQVLQDVVRRVDKAWKSFYQRIRKGTNKIIHYPRYKQTGRYDSFSYTQNNSFVFERSQIKLLKLGKINVRKHRELLGEVKTCSLLVKNQKYYVIFSCEVEKQPKLELQSIPLNRQVGIDVNTGKDNFYVLDNGDKQPNPHFFHKIEKELNNLERKLSLKKHKRSKEDKTKSSKNYQRSRLLFAKRAEKVVNKRNDFLFKEVKQLTNNYDFFGIEKLKIAKMIEDNSARGKWYSNKRMGDSSLSSFLNILAFKVEETGKWVVKINPYNTSQKCSNCQKLAKPRLGLEDRIFVCKFCKMELDRDVNSAKNILYKAQITEFGTNFVKQAHASQ